MKILELCHFTEGGCGVWTRAREESIRLAKRGHEVLILSSNAVKGKNETAPQEESIRKIKIKRFPFTKLGGESFMYWNFTKEALAFNPDVIIAHNYRQPHTTKALRIAKHIRKKKPCKVVLVTHAPFPEGNVTRTKMASIIVNLYDKTVGRWTLNKFDKILAISHWEIPHLVKIGAEKERIVYIPNGIPQEFFSQKKAREENKIVFLGRISPKKKLDTLVRAIPLLKDKKIKIEIIGPEEQPYAQEIHSLVKKLKVENRISFAGPVYELKEKIKKIDSAKVFVLPSRVEGMPQSLIDAMARGKIVIGSNSEAIRDLIKDGENGYLFEFDNPKSLANTIDKALTSSNKKIAQNAKKSVENYSWDTVIDQINDIITASKSLNTVSV